MNGADFSAQVDALLDRGLQHDAVALTRRLVAQRHPDALYRLATWHVIGSMVARDLVGARSLLTAASAAGHSQAAKMLMALTANGSGAQPDWSAALRLLRDWAPSDPQAGEEARLIDAMAISPDGLPTIAFDPQPLDLQSVVWRFNGLLSAEECSHIIAATRDYLAPALVFDPATGRQVRHPIRSADAMVVSPTREDLVLRAIALRLALASDTLVSQGEAISVMRYRPGQDFKLHHDSLDGTGNQRVKTMLVYLNDGFDGGETVFPHIGLTVVPRMGDAILFDNVRERRRLDIAEHAGLPVTRGEKWLLSKWMRARPFDLWKGPEHSM